MTKSERLLARLEIETLNAEFARLIVPLGTRG